MAKTYKIFIVSLATVCLTVSTVMCCCIASAAMAHGAKASVCSHCHTKNSSSDHAAIPGKDCLLKLTNAESLQAQIVSVAKPAVRNMVTHNLILLELSCVSPYFYPRGSPPITASFVPSYLRTLSLRI